MNGRARFHLSEHPGGKLADFGTASLLTKLEQNAEMVMGTPHYARAYVSQGLNFERLNDGRPK